jgi:hypothetical protein
MTDFFTLKNHQVLTHDPWLIFYLCHFSHMLYSSFLIPMLFEAKAQSFVDFFVMKVLLNFYGTDAHSVAEMYCGLFSTDA